MAQDTVDTLNKLVEASRDGEFGFRSAAEHAQGPDLQQLFAHRADECREAATQLQSVVEHLGGAAGHGGTLGGAAHRGWMAVKGNLAGYTDLALLEETERGEDIALQRYRDALESDMPPEVCVLVEGQYAGVKRNHAQLRLLRDQARRTNR
jgi:uncharacterized protein (TIGR02284 family)